MELLELLKLLMDSSSQVTTDQKLLAMRRAVEFLVDENAELRTLLYATWAGIILLSAAIIFDVWLDRHKTDRRIKKLEKVLQRKSEEVIQVS